MSLETFLIANRVYCEAPGCLNKAKVMRDVDGHKVVYCWQHDPDTITSFSQWLDSNQDAIGDETCFSEYLTRQGDSI